MEIIREEEISSKLRKTFRKKSKVYENDNKSPIRRPTVAAAIIVTNKLTSKTATNFTIIKFSYKYTY